MRSQPSIAGSTMYWLNRQVCALDLETGDFFQGFIPSNEISDMINGTWDNDSVQEYRLIHIGGDAEDVFCLVWSGCGECHFTRLRISKDYDSLEEEEEEEGRRVGDIHISIISCSSMFTPEIYSLTDVMLMDRVDGTNSTKEVKLESACERMPNKDASGSGRVLKRCKKRSVDSVKALSQKEGASLCEVVISKKLKLESACEEMPKTGKKLKPIKQTPIRNLWTCGGCVYKNIPQDMKCKGCHQVDKPYWNIHIDANGGRWICTKCERKILHLYIRCNFCGAPFPTEDKSLVLKCNGCDRPCDSHAPNCPKLMGRWQCAKCKKFNLHATTECTGPDCKADKQFDPLLTGEDEVQVPKEAEIVAGEKKKLSKKSADDEFDFVGAAMKLNYLPLPKYKWIDPDLE